YMSDDGTAKGFWKFVSDQKINDFSPNWSGSLFAAKLKQLDAAKGGQFKMSWIKLGHSSDQEIRALIKNKPRITDIFDIKVPQDKQCPAQFTPVFEDGMLECLRLKKGQELAAAFLESRKYAAYLGATIEFRKEEGLTFDPVKRKLYLAMSQISKSMEDNYHGLETSNDIRLPINNCGAVYELNLDDNYSATSMKALVVGQALLPAEPEANRYYCNPNNISNPDNIAFIGLNTLLISEDTVFHVNNMSWAYNTSTGTLTRIASLPIGAEITGVATANIKPHGFLFMNQQHPFVDGPINAKGENVFSHLIENASDQDQKAIIGYVSGFPSGVLSD
ncbi:MAG: alkaline phosphatase PhoX, partial [bacterium]